MKNTILIIRIIAMILISLKGFSQSYSGLVPYNSASSEAWDGIITDCNISIIGTTTQNGVYFENTLHSLNIQTLRIAQKDIAASQIPSHVKNGINSSANIQLSFDLYVNNVFVDRFGQPSVSWARLQGLAESEGYKPATKENGYKLFNSGALSIRNVKIKSLTYRVDDEYYTQVRNQIAGVDNKNTGNPVKEGTHSMQAGSSCKFAKNRCTNMEGCPQCAICNQNNVTESKAKQAEITRREDAEASALKAKQISEQKAFEAEQKRKRDEAEREKLEAANAEIKREALRKKYAEIAKNGEVKMSNDKFAVQSNYIEDLKDFVIPDKRIYGLTFMDSRVIEIPFPNEITRVSMKRLAKSNFFLVKLISKDNSVSNHIIDMYGNKISIDGNDTFFNAFGDDNLQTIYLQFLKSEPIQIGDKLVGGANAAEKVVFVNGMAEVEAHYQTYLNSDFRGLGFGYFVTYANATLYVLDFQMLLKEKKEGILIIHSR